MPRITVYLDEAAYAYVKSKPPGWIRRLIAYQMTLAKKEEKK